MLDAFDRLRKHITSKEGKEAAKEFRKMLKRSEDYSDRLEIYFRNTLDGASPEQEKESLNL